MKQSFRDLNELLYERQREGNPISKTELASSLGVWPSKLTTLLNPRSYRVSSLSDDLVSKIAKVLNQPPTYVRKLYAEAA